MEKLVNKIYKFLCSYNPILKNLERDVKQEIRIAVLLNSPDIKKIYREANRLVHKLCKQYGFSRKKGKDNFQPFYNQASLTGKQSEMIETIEKKYLIENMTAKELCEHFEIEYSNKIAKLLCKTFPKAMGKGGARKNAGMRR